MMFQSINNDVWIFLLKKSQSSKNHITLILCFIIHIYRQKVTKTGHNKTRPPGVANGHHRVSSPGDSKIIVNNATNEKRSLDKLRQLIGFFAPKASRYSVEALKTLDDETVLDIDLNVFAKSCELEFSKVMFQPMCILLYCVLFCVKILLILSCFNGFLNRSFEILILSV